MSVQPSIEPHCTEAEGRAPLLIESRSRDLGGFQVRRVLPAPLRRSVGPFVFFDEMGPAKFPVGEGMDVRPHPHIGLATLTYLFDGVVMHRDSLGTSMPILPGEVNLMTAGRGIVHSERIPSEERQKGASLHGIQLWIALPTSDEELEPAFDHYPSSALPRFAVGTIEVVLIAGEAYEHRSPVQTYSPMLYASLQASEAGSINLPQVSEIGLYIVAGAAKLGSRMIYPGSMGVIDGGRDRRVELDAGTRLMMIGGEPFPEERFVFWNFVSSSRERIERAKDDWTNERFPFVPGDDKERIPLPE